MRRLLGAVAITVALAGCGGDATPASVVPADAAVYVSVAAGEPAERLVDGLDLRALDYREDVRPWIGKRAAFFATREEGAALVLTARDDGDAEEWARRQAGITQFSFWEMVDGQLVLASSPRALSAARDAADRDRALADGERFDEDEEREEDAPAAILVAHDKRAAAGAATRFRRLPSVTESAALELLPDEGTVTSRLWLGEHQTRLDVTGLGPARPAPPRLDDLSGAAWLAMATPDLGKDLLAAAGIGFTGTSLFTRAQLSTGIDLEDLLAELGGATLLVQGSDQDDFSAQLQVAVRDEAAIRRAAIATARALRRSESVELYTDGPEDAEPFVDFLSSLTDRDPTGTGLLDFVSVHVEDERLVVRSGVQVGGTDEDLGETAAFRDAERRLGAPPMLYVELAPLASLLGLEPQPDGAYVAASETSRDGRRVNRFVLVRP